MGNNYGELLGAIDPKILNEATAGLKKLANMKGGDGDGDSPKHFRRRQTSEQEVMPAELKGRSSKADSAISSQLGGKGSFGADPDIASQLGGKGTNPLQTSAADKKSAEYKNLKNRPGIPKADKAGAPAGYTAGSKKGIGGTQYITIKVPYIPGGAIGKSIEGQGKGSTTSPSKSYVRSKGGAGSSAK